jgi:hypothetical protein
MESQPADERTGLLSFVNVQEYVIAQEQAAQAVLGDELPDGIQIPSTAETRTKLTRTILTSIWTRLSSYSPIPLELPTPLPWKSVFAIMLLYSTQPVAYELVMPFSRERVIHL